MSFRSMSDGQMLAKYGYDKEPWVDRNGERYVDPKFAMAVTLDFAQRPECIPSRDPLPYLTGLGGRCAGPTFRFFNTTAPAYWSPRREFMRPPVNPILSAFRDSALRDDPSHWYVADGVKQILLNATDQQVDDARRVLERLAAVYAA